MEIFYTSALQSATEVPAKAQILGNKILEFELQKILLIVHPL